MSVYIKGMEMPKNCSDCPMCYDMMECTVGTPRIGFYKNEMKKDPFDFCNERHPRCPLVPVPEHGDLIDADALVHSYYHAPSFPNLCKAISNAPTIIPADQKKEETE